MRKPIVCCVTDRKSAGAPASVDGVVRSIQEAVGAGVDWVQIREKDLQGGKLLELARKAVRIAGARTRVVVNDRLDVALAAGAGGVHLGGESLEPGELARWLRAKGDAPEDFLSTLNSVALRGFRVTRKSEFSSVRGRCERAGAAKASPISVEKTTALTRPPFAWRCAWREGACDGW